MIIRLCVTCSLTLTVALRHQGVQRSSSTAAARVSACLPLGFGWNSTPACRWTCLPCRRDKNQKGSCSQFYLICLVASSIVCLQVSFAALAVLCSDASHFKTPALCYSNVVPSSLVCANLTWVFFLLLLPVSRGTLHHSQEVICVGTVR